MNVPLSPPFGTVFRTASLDLATFLKFTGHPLLGTDSSNGSLIEFLFPANVAPDVATYNTGEVVVQPRQLFETYHALRVMLLNFRKQAQGISPRRSGGAV
jgi:hypothetical protein